MKTPPTAIWIMVLAATFFWGSNFNAAHALAGALPPLTAASGRFGIAVLILLGMRALRGRAESTIDLRDMIALCALGLVGVFGFNFAFFTAMHSTSSLNGALIMALSPLLTSLFAAQLLGVALRARQLLGIAVAFIGVTFVITGGHVAALHIARGDWWMLGACIAWSSYSVLVQKFVPHVPPLQQARWTIGAGAAALIGFAAVREPLAAIAMQSLDVNLIVLYMAICGTVLAYIFWLRGVQFLGSQRASIAFNLVPAFTLLVNLLFGQWPNGAQIGGLLTLVAGVLIATGGRPRLAAAPLDAQKTAPMRAR